MFLIPIFAFFVLFGFFALVAWWVGLMGLSRAGRDSAWWIMAVGIPLNSLGIILSASPIFLPKIEIGVSWEDRWALALFLPIAMGAPLFGIGFALHGMKSLAAGKRTQELEAILAAQSAELEQLRASSVARKL